MTADRPIRKRPEGQRRRTLRDPVLAIVADLSRTFGKCFASEPGFRRELYRRTELERPGQGYVCGARSIGRVIARLVARGELGKERVKPNRLLANGQRTAFGSTHTWIVPRRVQRKARRRENEIRRQEKHRASRAERDRLSAEQYERERVAREVAPRTAARTDIAQRSPILLTDLLRSSEPPAPEPRDEARREEVERQLAELARSGFELPPKKPPE